MKPLSWNEIKDRALKFTNEWKNESSEDAEAKSFWDGLFEVFGVPRRRITSFEVSLEYLFGMYKELTKDLFTGETKGRKVKG